LKKRRKNRKAKLNKEVQRLNGTTIINQYFSKRMRTILTIWTKPIETFEYLDKNVDKDLNVKLNILFLLGSFSLENTKMIENYKMAGDHSIGYIIITSLIGILFGALFIKFVYVIAMWLVGKMLQGKATRYQIQLVIAYAMIPCLISLFFSFVLITIAIIMNDIDFIGYQNPLTLFIIWIFGIRTMINGITKFNKYSYGYAWINLCIVAVFFQGIIIGIKQLIN